MISAPSASHETLFFFFSSFFLWPREKVEQVNVAERSIKLSGVDLVDGTPVLDIKPYVPDYDCPRPRDSPGSESAGGDGGVRVAVSGCRDRGSKNKRFGGKAGGYATAAYVLSLIADGLVCTAALATALTTGANNSSSEVWSEERVRAHVRGWATVD